MPECTEAERVQWAERERIRRATSDAPLKSVRAWKRRNRKKLHAQKTVWKALRDGRLVRQPCEVCGAPKAHAHHDDYSRRLCVRWLCPVHHKAWHRENGEGANAHDESETK